MNLTDTEIAALVISIKTALLSLLCVLPVGVGIGWLLAKASFRGKSFAQYPCDAASGTTPRRERLSAADAV